MNFLLALLLSFSALASTPELFGPTAGSIAIGNLPATNSAGNNYFAASLLAFSKGTQFSFDTFYISTSFKDIDNVVIRNSTNTVDRPVETGEVEVNPTPTALFGAHLSIPLFDPTGPKFNISIIAPYDRLLEADTGDPYQPSYVMYANRFIRPSIHLSAAHAINSWGFSLGVMTGMQSGGETYIITRTGNDPSLAKISFSAKPSIGATASVAKRWDSGQESYLAFQQEMKSNFENRASGETEIGGGGAYAFDFKVRSLLFYDPMTIRLGHRLKHESWTLHMGAEYQQWSNYETPTIKISKRGGSINGTNDFEDLDPKDIIIPKVGVEKILTDTWIAKAGYFFRPTPLDPDKLAGAGNSIDTDKHVLSGGLAKILQIRNKDVALDMSYQVHLLKSHKVEKTAGTENGSAGNKIGSPGYTVGGMIHVLSLGLSWMY